MVYREWPWCSLWIHQFGLPEHRAMLSDWPCPRKWINEPATEAELEAIRQSCRRAAPYGSTDWAEKTAENLKRCDGLGDLKRPNLHLPPFSSPLTRSRIMNAVFLPRHKIEFTRWLLCFVFFYSSRCKRGLFAARMNRL